MSVHFRWIILLTIIAWASGCLRVRVITPVAWNQPSQVRAASDVIEGWDSAMAQERAKNQDRLEFMERHVRAIRKPAGALTLQIVEEAQNYIEHAASSCPRCWDWPRVLDNIRKLHRGVPIMAVAPFEQSAKRKLIAAYNFYSDDVAVDERMISAFPIPDVAAILVHEMTHRAQAQRDFERTGYDKRDLILLVDRCPDVAWRRSFAHEFVADWNQIEWSRRASSEMTLGPMNANMVAWHALHAAGEEDVSNETLRRMQTERLTAYADHFGPIGGGSRCGPPLIVRGPHAGTYDHPKALAPNLLEPVFAAVLGE